MDSFRINSTSIVPSGKHNIVSMSISATGMELLSLQLEIMAPRSMTDLVDIQDHVAKVVIEHLQVLKKIDPKG